jgi:hypothetical protein
VEAAQMVLDYRVQLIFFEFAGIIGCPLTERDYEMASFDFGGSGGLRAGDGL